jgi:hypothetical protein
MLEFTHQHLKTGENQFYVVIYGCPEKYLTQEKVDEANKTKQASTHMGSHQD